MIVRLHYYITPKSIQSIDLYQKHLAIPSLGPTTGLHLVIDISSAVGSHLEELGQLWLLQHFPGLLIHGDHSVFP